MSGYLITLAITIGIYIILSLSLNILVGYAGQVSLGHAAFWAIGAYAFAILTTKYSVGFAESTILAVIITTIIGVILGLPSLRLSEDFLVITTIGINFIVQGIFNTFNYFGGAMGIGGIPFPTYHNQMISSLAFAGVVYVGVVFTIIISYLFKLSWGGLACFALKDDETAANVNGVPTVKFKLIAFAISSALAGLSGVFYASFMSFISANDFSFPVSVTILAMVMIGGEATIIGPIFGSVLLIILPEIFRPIHDYRMLLYGVLIVLMMRFQPDGFFGKRGIIWNLLKKS